MRIEYIINSLIKEVSLAKITLEKNAHDRKLTKK